MTGPLGIIVAFSPERVIGLFGSIPWHYPADLKRFRRLTIGSTVIMGRLTYESIGKPLKDRRNIVITRQPAIEGVECFASIQQAVATCTGPVWFIGGARIYEEAMPLCDILDVTLVPDRIDHPEAVRFPEIDPARWTAKPPEPLPDDERLLHQVFTKTRE